MLETRCSSRYEGWSVAPWLCGACLFLLIAGCASTGSIRNSGPTLGDRFAHYDSVVLETICELPNSESQRQLLHSLVASGLQQSGSYRRVTGVLPADDSASYLKVTERVAKLGKVTDVARVLVGALAGRADVVVDVDLTAGQTGAQSEHFQAIGKSSAGWVGAGTTDQALQRVAEQIVAEILKRER